MKTQQGSFIIEFALFSVFFSTLILFTADIVIKQDLAGQLDRLSYSAVNLLKERSELYQRNAEIDQAQVDQIKALLDSSLNRSYNNFIAGDFSIKVEQQLVDGDNNTTTGDTLNRGDFICNPAQSLASLVANVPELAPITNSGNRANLYQATLCYRAKDFIGNGTSTIRAFSFSLGR